MILNASLLVSYDVYGTETRYCFLPILTRHAGVRSFNIIDIRRFLLVSIIARERKYKSPQSEDEPVPYLWCSWRSKRYF